MQRWQVEFESLAGLFPSSVRWAWCQPLGARIIGEDDHHSRIKPHSVRSVTVREDRRGLTAVVCWLVDSHPSPRDPAMLVGLESDFHGVGMRCVRAERVAEVAQVALLGDVFCDPWLPDPAGSVVDPVVEFRVTSVSPWMFAKGDPVGELHAGRLVSRIARRWNDILAWRPGAGTEGGPAPVRAMVPQPVVDELVECTSLVSVSRLREVADQVDYDERRRRPLVETGVEVDAVIRCAPGDPVTLMWFQALMRFSVWSGVGRRVTSGLGQVDVQRVRTLRRLPHAVVPGWEVW